MKDFCCVFFFCQLLLCGCTSASGGGMAPSVLPRLKLTHLPDEPPPTADAKEAAPFPLAALPTEGENRLPAVLLDRVQQLDGDVVIPLDPTLVSEREHRLQMIYLLQDIREELRSLSRPSGALPVRRK